jgi:hypothetical protein
MRSVVTAPRPATVTHPPVMGVALICTTLGRWAELEHLLASVVRKDGVLTRVIVVDQSHVLREVPLNDQGLDVVTVPDPRRGISRGRNLGIDALVRSVPAQEAASWLVGFPDDDVWFEADTIAAAIRASSGYDFVSGALLCRDGTPGRAQWPVSECVLDRWTLLGRTVEAATFIRLSAFASGARFDERIGAGSGTPLGSGEGVELLSRLAAAGLSGCFSPAIRVFEDAPEESRERSESYARGEGASIYLGLPAGWRRWWRLSVRPLLRPVRELLGGQRPRFNAAWRRARFLRAGAALASTLPTTAAHVDARQ